MVRPHLGSPPTKSHDGDRTAVGTSGQVGNAGRTTDRLSASLALEIYGYLRAAGGTALCGLSSRYFTRWRRLAVRIVTLKILINISAKSGSAGLDQTGRGSTRPHKAPA